MVSSTPTDKTETTTQVEEITTKNPPKWCSVSLSDVISRGKRLDASVFDVEAKQAWTQIKKGNTVQYCLGMEGSLKLRIIPGDLNGFIAAEGMENHFSYPLKCPKFIRKPKNIFHL